MYQTIQVSTCVSAQGELVESLPNGDAIVRDGLNTYRGRPIIPQGARTTAEHAARQMARRGDEA